MDNNTKDNIIFFLIGILLGILTTVTGGLYAYKVIKSGGGIDFPSFSSNEKAETPKASKAPAGVDFHLGFENNADISFFNVAENAGFALSDEHATAGKKSMQVKIPSGTEYPGLEWEVYGKDALNWEGKETFSFDAYNNSENAVAVEIKFKSGKDYPKKSISIPAVLDAQKDNHIDISMGQLEGAIDLGRVSYIKIFSKSPQENQELYVDEIQVK